MELFGTITAAIGVLDQSRQLVSAIRKQHRRMRKVPEKCNEVEKGLNEIGRILHELEEYKPDSIPEMANRQAQSMSEYLENARGMLEKERSKRVLASRTWRFLRARKVLETLEELIDGIRCVELKGLMCGLAAHHAVTLQTSSGVKEDVFVSQYNVPPTPAKLVLKLNDSSTHEEQLKEKVLRFNSRTVGAVGVRVTAAQGMSGVAKTCAVTAVGNDSDVQKHYSGGVYFLSFGQDAKSGDLVNKVADKVKESGGERLSKEIRNENDVNTAVEKSRAWFGDHKCLFICDDMWRCEG